MSCPASRAKSQTRRQLPSERGTITTLFAVLAIFFFAIVSLVSEGGRKLGNLSLAEDVASEAARAAAATLDVDGVAAGRAVIDPDEDRAELQASLIVASVPNAQIESIMISADRVEVVVRVSGDSWIPGFDLDGVGSHSARALDPFGR